MKWYEKGVRIKFKTGVYHGKKLKSGKKYQKETQG